MGRECRQSEANPTVRVYGSIARGTLLQGLDCLRLLSPPQALPVRAGVRAARKAESLGADAVIAVGVEGGGHLGRDDIATMVLTPRIVEAVKIPVLASGGIADGRGLAASLALGAEGVELGTRFVAVRESNAHPNYQKALVEANRFVNNEIAAQVDLMLLLKAITDEVQKQLVEVVAA